MWHYRILDHVPVSGKYEEIIFGGCDGTFTRVRFFNDNNEWVGVFQNGKKYRLRVYIFDRESVVLAAGFIYIIDLNAKQADFVSDKNDYYDLIADPQMMFSADSDSIFIMKRPSVVKQLELSYFDDFLFSGMDSHKVYCKGYQSEDGWFEFAIDRVKLEIAQGMV